MRAAVPVAKANIGDLRAVATEVRRLIVRTVHRAGAGHVGGPLSATDILVTLFFQAMRVDPTRPQWPQRDRLVLSKGHSCVALYAVMALRGYFPVAELDTFDQLDSRLQGHPDMTRLEALDMSTGSLGQGFSAAVGMALGAKLTNVPFHTWVVLGDGECQEGQVWEAAQIAARYRLGNLTAIIDVNGLQQYGWPDPLLPSKRQAPFTNMAAMWAANGWRVDEIDGHDWVQLTNALVPVPVDDGRPRVVLASTVKGRGISFMEGRPESHAMLVTTELLEKALDELGRPT